MGTTTTLYLEAPSADSALRDLLALDGLSLTGLPIGNGRLVADSADATGANRYRWCTKGPGDLTFITRAVTTTSEALIHELRVTGLNSGGAGPASRDRGTPSRVFEKCAMRACRARACFIR